MIKTYEGCYAKMARNALMNGKGHDLIRSFTIHIVEALILKYLLVILSSR